MVSWLGFEPLTSRSRGGRSTTWAIQPDKCLCVCVCVCVCVRIACASVCVCACVRVRARVCECKINVHKSSTYWSTTVFLSVFFSFIFLLISWRWKTWVSFVGQLAGHSVFKSLGTPVTCSRRISIISQGGSDNLVDLYWERRELQSSSSQSAI
jgi:hypothetical protein